MEQLQEPNVRLERVDYKRATVEFERMENEMRIVLERKIAAGEDVRRKALNMDDLDALRVADASIKSE